MAVDILDTHQHLIYPDRFGYAWTEGIPALTGAFTYTDYLAAAGDGGIAQTLFMEVDVDDPAWREETRFFSDMARDPATLLAGVIANGRPEHTGFDDWLDAVADMEVVGIRRICHTSPDELSQGDTFVASVRKLADRNLTFDLCFLERQLPLAAALARACPDTKFVLDHCGVPTVAAGDLDPWRQHIRDLAALPNVACKISGITAYANPGEGTLNTVRPWLEHCVESFGWDRVVWGSDWPVCNLNSDLATWIAISREFVAGEDEANQQKLFHANAARIYGVGG